MAYDNQAPRPRRGDSPTGKPYARGRVVRGANGAGRGGYVPGTRAGRGESARQTSLGAKGRGGRESRAVSSQRGERRYRSERNYRTLAGHDTGYTLHGGTSRGRSLGLAGRPNDLLGAYGISNRLLALAAAMVVALALVVAGVASCRSMQPQEGGDAPQTQGNPWDARVAAGATQELTELLSARLNQNDKLKTIAEEADRYSTERAVELALIEDAAIDYVASLPDAEKVGKAYGDSVQKGSFPSLFTWDERWGYVDYGGAPLGVTGSGPTALAMAYLGLSGNDDQTPATIAEAATDSGLSASKDPFTADDFVPSMAQSLGMSATEYTASGDNLIEALQTDGVALVLLEKGLTFPYPHWALVAGINEDGSAQLLDPLSTDASAHAWSLANLGTHTLSLYGLSYTGSAGEPEGNVGSTASAATSAASGGDSAGLSGASSTGTTSS